MKSITRRTFLRHGVAGTAAAVSFPTIVPSDVLGANGAISPSNQIAIGQIGFGWIGGSHLGTLLGRNDVRCVADVEIGARSATICHLGNIAYQLGQELKWDPAQERLIGNEEANRLLSRPMRSPWHL